MFEINDDDTIKLVAKFEFPSQATIKNRLSYLLISFMTGQYEVASKVAHNVVIHVMLLIISFLFHWKKSSIYRFYICNAFSLCLLCVWKFLCIFR